MTRDRESYLYEIQIPVKYAPRCVHGYNSIEDAIVCGVIRIEVGRLLDAGLRLLTGRQ